MLCPFEHEKQKDFLSWNFFKQILCMATQINHFFEGEKKFIGNFENNKIARHIFFTLFLNFVPGVTTLFTKNLRKNFFVQIDT